MQLEQSWKSYPLAFVASVIVTSALTVSLSQSPIFRWVAISGALHLALCCVMLARWRTGSRLGWRFEDPVRRARVTASEAVLVSAGWFLFLSVAGVRSTAESQTLIVAVMAGVLAVGAFRYSALPLAAMSFLGTAGSVLVAYSVATELPISIYCFLGIFLILLGKYSIAQSHLLERQARSAGELVMAKVQLDLARAEEKRKSAHVEVERIRAKAAAEQERQLVQRESVDHIADELEAKLLPFLSELVQHAEEEGLIVEQLTVAAGQGAQVLESLVKHARSHRAGLRHLATSTSELRCSIDSLRGQIDSQNNATSRVGAATASAEAKFAELRSEIEGIESLATMIEEVANRINLVALNATIEAARAGAAGSGFGVVASEVKGLAFRTHSATVEVRDRTSRISALIVQMLPVFGEMQACLKAFSELAGTAEDPLTRNSEILSQIEHQASNAGSLAQQVEAEASESGAAARQASLLSSRARRLSEGLVSKSKSLVVSTNGFVSGLRSVQP